MQIQKFILYPSRTSAVSSVQFFNNDKAQICAMVGYLMFLN